MKNAIIIGSGLSGLIAAAALAQAGYAVTVLEQFVQTGGVTASYEKDGYRWNLGHLFILLVFFLAACTAPPAPAPAPVTVVVISTPAPAVRPSATIAPTQTPAPLPTRPLPGRVTGPLTIYGGNSLVWMAETGQEATLDAGTAQEKLEDFTLYVDGTCLLLVYSSLDGGMRYRWIDLAAKQAYDLYQGNAQLPAYAFSPDGKRWAYFAPSTADSASLGVFVRPVQPGAEAVQVGSASPGSPLVFYWLPNSSTLVWSAADGVWASQDAGPGRQLYDRPAVWIGDPSPGQGFVFLATADPSGPGCYARHVLFLERLQIYPVPGGLACGTLADHYRQVAFEWVSKASLKVSEQTLDAAVWRWVEGEGARRWEDGGPLPPSLPHAAGDDLALVDGAIVQTDARTGEWRSLVAPRPAPEAWVEFAASPDLRWLALVVARPGEGKVIRYTLELFDRQSGQTLTLHEGQADGNYTVIDMAFSPDGEWFAYISAEMQTAMEPGGRRGLASPPRPAPLSGAAARYPVNLLRTSRPQEQILAGTWKAGIMRGKRGTSVFGAPLDSPYRVIAWGEPGPFLLWANTMPYSLSKVDPARPGDAQTLMAGDAWASQVYLGAISPDGRYIVTRNDFAMLPGEDGLPPVEIADLQQGEIIRLPPGAWPVSAPAGAVQPQPLPIWLPDGRLLLTRPSTITHVYRIDPDVAEFFSEVP